MTTNQNNNKKQLGIRKKGNASDLQEQKQVYTETTESKGASTETVVGYKLL